VGSGAWPHLGESLRALQAVADGRAERALRCAPLLAAGGLAFSEPSAWLAETNRPAVLLLEGALQGVFAHWGAGPIRASLALAAAGRTHRAPARPTCCWSLGAPRVGGIRGGSRGLAHHRGKHIRRPRPAAPQPSTETLRKIAWPARLVGLAGWPAQSGFEPGVFRVVGCRIPPALGGRLQGSTAAELRRPLDERVRRLVAGVRQPERRRPWPRPRPGIALGTGGGPERTGWPWRRLRAENWAAALTQDAASTLIDLRRWRFYTPDHEPPNNRYGWRVRWI